MKYSNKSIPYEIDMIADTQAEILEYADSLGYDMTDFIRGYMASDFCNREMDSVYSYYHFKMDTQLLPIIVDESGHEYKKRQNLETSELTNLHFIGKVYRFLAFFTEIPSKELIKRISPEKLDDLSVTYETYEIEYAAKEIIEKYL